jgi:pimeloyl-ACP methyl ester carboxylesterase
MYQVEYFARARAGQYTVLVFDNRGAGNSGTPHGPYTTSTMAEDVIALLDYVGWTEKRGVHLVGISLGGMIAQGAFYLLFYERQTNKLWLTEIAWRTSERIASLMLAVTTAGGPIWTNFPPVSSQALS